MKGLLREAFYSFFEHTKSAGCCEFDDEERLGRLKAGLGCWSMKLIQTANKFFSGALGTFRVRAMVEW
jgi:hypothetical protein